MRLTTISSTTGSIGGGLQTRLIRTSDAVIHVFTSYADNQIVHKYSINNGKTFSSPETLSFYSATFSFHKDFNDALHLVFVGIDGKLYYAKGIKNGYTFSWSSAVIVDASPSGVFSSSLTILLDNYSNIHIFLGSTNFYWYRSPNGISWIKTTVHTLTLGAHSGSAIVDPDNNLLIVSLGYTGSSNQRKVYSCKITYSSGSWSVGTVNEIESGGYVLDPSQRGALDLEITPDGKIIYIYSTQEGAAPSPTHIYFRKSINAYDIATWNAVDLATYACGTRSQAVLSILSSSNYRIYQEATDGKIYCRESLDSGIVWLETLLIDVGSPASVGISIGKGDWGYLDLMVIGSLLYLYLGRNPYAQWGLVYEEDETGDTPLVEIFPDTIAFYDGFEDWAIVDCLAYEDTIKFKTNGAVATMMADWDEPDWLYISTRIKFDQEGIGGSLILQINLGGGWITLETYTASGRYSTVCTPYGSGIRLIRTGNSTIQVDYLVLSAKEKRSLTENIIGLNVKLQTLNKGVNSCEVDLFNENFQYSTNNPYDFKVSDYIMVWMGKLGTGIRNKMFDGRISEIDYSGAGYGTQKIVINGQAFSAEMSKPPIILYKRYSGINGETILDEYLDDLVQVRKSVFPDEWFNGTIVTLFNTKFEGINPLSVFQNILENSYDINDERGMEVVEIPPGTLIGHEKDSTEWKVNTILNPNKYTKSDDLTPLYNCIDIFGNDTKMYPSDGDSWTESWIAGWLGLYGSTVSLTSVPSPKVGTYSVKVLVAPQVVTWQEWYQAEGWGNGYYPPWGLRYTHFEQTISCFPGKKIRFHGAGVYETLAADGCVRIYYRFGDTDPWTQLVTPPPAEVGGSYRELYPWTVAPEYVEGPTETNLNVKWEMETFAYKTSMFSNFRIYYLEVPLGTQEKFAASFTLPILDYPNGLDLDLPDSPTKLEFVLGSLIEEPSSGTDSNPTVFIRMNMKDAAPITYHGEFSGIKGGDWETFSIDVGPDADNQGWSSIPTGKVRSIEFEFTVYTDFYHATDFLQIDWLHFGNAKFSGTYSDAASIAQYGERWAETIEDTTLLSDDQCDLKAKTLVLMNKDPVLTFSPIEVDGSTIYIPSFLINVQVPNENFNRWLSILEIEHKLEGTEWLTSLIIGTEPVTINYVIRNMRGK